MSEFQLYESVNECFKLFSVDDDQAKTNYIEVLQKSIGQPRESHSSTHLSVANQSADSKEFLQHFSNLSDQGCPSLKPFTELLDGISKDRELKGALKQHADDEAARLQTVAPNVIETLTESQTTSTGSSIHIDPEKLKSKLLKSNFKELPPDTEFQAAMKKEKKQPAWMKNLPPFANWVDKRPLLTDDFITDDSVDFSLYAPEPLAEMLTRRQEELLVEDLLYCLTGVSGSYLQAKPLDHPFADRKFAISDSNIDVSLREMCRKILPVCQDYSLVVRFIEEYSKFKHGTVCQALTSGMRAMLKEYQIFIVQLEEQHLQGELSLAKMVAVMQSPSRNMKVLSSIASAIISNSCRGGALLSLLRQKILSLLGDGKQALCVELMKQASSPFFSMLSKWLYRGVIVDPFWEFMVAEDSEFNKESLQEEYIDKFWEQHHILRKENIPNFLEPVAQKILDTGKYLTVVRECGGQTADIEIKTFSYDTDEKNFLDVIDDAHGFSSDLLLSLFTRDYDLLGHLRSVKHFFLLDKGDFIFHFMDVAEDEMKRSVEEIALSRLEALLELSLRCSTTDVDPYKDDLRVLLLPYDLITHLLKITTIESKLEKEFNIDPTELDLSGLESFSFDFVVEWPLSLILNRKALTRYQILFRHLFYCKHVERQLCGVWLTNSLMKGLRMESGQVYSSAFALLQQMLHFVQNLQYYMLFEVVEPGWHSFETDLQKVSNVDELLALHMDLLNGFMRDCMLTERNLLSITNKLMVVCITFSNFMQKSLQSNKLDESTFASPKKSEQQQQLIAELLEEMGVAEAFEETVNKFRENFVKLLAELLSTLVRLSQRENEKKLIRIVKRLDFNGFYTNKLLPSLMTTTAAGIL